MSIEAIRELETLASVCPELNMANYTEDDVRHLNDWAIEMSLLAEKVAAMRPERVPMTDTQLCEALGIDGSDDWTYQVRDAVEAHHGITAQAKKENQTAKRRSASA